MYELRSAAFICSLDERMRRKRRRVGRHDLEVARAALDDDRADRVLAPRHSARPIHRRASLQRREASTVLRWLVRAARAQRRAGPARMPRALTPPSAKATVVVRNLAGSADDSWRTIVELIVQRTSASTSLRFAAANASRPASSISFASAIQRSWSRARPGIISRFADFGERQRLAPAARPIPRRVFGVAS